MNADSCCGSSLSVLAQKERNDLPRKGFNSCGLCGTEYIIGITGGYRYCDQCKVPARRKMTKYYRLKPSHTDGRVMAGKRREEYGWEFACSICGIKHQHEEGASSCCSGLEGRKNPPIQASGGFYWLSQQIKDTALARSLGLMNPSASVG